MKHYNLICTHFCPPVIPSPCCVLWLVVDLWCAVCQPRCGLGMCTALPGSDFKRPQLWIKKRNSVAGTAAAEFRCTITKNEKRRQDQRDLNFISGQNLVITGDSPLIAEKRCILKPIKHKQNAFPPAIKPFPWKVVLKKKRHDGCPAFITNKLTLQNANIYTVLQSEYTKLEFLNLE